MPHEIGGHPVGSGAPLFVIAELGLNHGGSSAKALALVDAAARAGASAVKLQTLRADRLVAADCPAPAHLEAASLRDLFRTFELDDDAHRQVAARAHALGLAFISTPFYLEAIDLLESVGCDAYKIASGDLTNLALIERAARTGKPVILSTGMGELPEISRALARAECGGAGFVTLLHCVSAYPVPAGQENLAALAQLARRFGVSVGLSDHGTCPGAVAAAVALGASIYERHFVSGTDGDEIDAAVSSGPVQMRELVATADRVRQALGTGAKTCGPAEAANRMASRRGLYAVRGLRPGDRISERDVVALRPAKGLDASRWFDLVGRTLKRDVAAGAVFEEADLREEADKGAVREVA
jgi:N,N'-diacetyllegionaminate synthase